MKYTIISILLLINAISISSQNNNLSFMQGLKSPDGNIILEVSGYDIYIDNFEGEISNPDILSDIAYNLGFGEIKADYSESTFGIESRVLESEVIISTSPYLRTIQTCYLLQLNTKEIVSLLFVTINNRNAELERAVVEEYLKNKLLPYIIDSKTEKSFSFIGRKITPKEDWEMINPHAVSGDGVQIRWSEFNTLKDAELDIQNRIILDKSEMRVLMEENINVTFEVMATKANRIVYNDGASHYPLIAYYVVQKVRGKYVSCIMSNYGHNKDDYYLNSILEQVMSIPNLPDNAFRLPEPEPEPEPEPVYIYSEAEYEPWNFMDVQVGTRIPVGKLSNIYSSATILALYFKILSIQSTMLDAGMQVGFPSGANEFKYYYSGKNHTSDYGTTEADVLLNFNIRARWEKRFRSNLRLQYYVGLGYESLSTNLYKNTSIDEYGDEVDNNYAVRTIDLFGGINIKHKYVGLFIEYHYTPYSMFNKVKSGFGNSAFHGGILVTL
ncbi:hypothetical protein [Bacteroides sp. 519]|uniref:hypothetical protein n=1 Tax=Bacteroides sp. 519 TaxID=2302937 RepID=UPI0013D54C7E|nr:hypothetical protein [Bacteroides sp. 519]NDV60422.1 hypothetical protein [Bacteroides sp. 519]